MRRAVAQGRRCPPGAELRQAACVARVPGRHGEPHRGRAWRGVPPASRQKGDDLAGHIRTVAHEGVAGLADDQMGVSQQLSSNSKGNRSLSSPGMMSPKPAFGTVVKTPSGSRVLGPVRAAVRTRCQPLGGRSGENHPRSGPGNFCGTAEGCRAGGDRRRAGWTPAVSRGMLQPPGCFRAGRERVVRQSAPAVEQGLKKQTS